MIFPRVGVSRFVIAILRDFKSKALSALIRQATRVRIRGEALSHRVLCPIDRFLLDKEARAACVQPRPGDACKQYTSDGACLADALLEHTKGKIDPDLIWA